MNPHWPTLRLNHHSGFEYLTETTQHQTPSWMQCPHIGTSEALRWDWTNPSLNAIDATCVLLKPECVLVQYTLDMHIPPWTVHCYFMEGSNAPRSSSHQGRNQTYSGANFQITYIHMAETSRRWNKLKWYTHELSELCPLQHNVFRVVSLVGCFRKRLVCILGVTRSLNINNFGVCNARNISRKYPQFSSLNLIVFLVWNE